MVLRNEGQLFAVHLIYGISVIHSVAEGFKLRVKTHFIPERSSVISERGAQRKQRKVTEKVNHHHHHHHFHHHIITIIVIVIIIIVVVIIIIIIIVLSNFSKTLHDASVKQSNQRFHHNRQHPGFAQWDGHSSPTRVLPLLYRKVSARMTPTMYNLLSSCNECRR